MAYSRNFGFRSFENIVRDARFRVPKTGTPYLIGTAVTVDIATPGFLTRPAAAAAPNPLSGIVLYEHIQMIGVDPNITTSFDPPFNQVPLGNYAQMVHGVGVKVWLRNTTDRPLYDGRTLTGVTMVAGLGATPTVAVGDYLTPAADGTWTEGTAANGWLVVEQLNTSTGLVEARLTF